VFRGWQRALGPHVSVWPILLPGREKRAGETRFVDLTALIEDLASHLEPFLECPHVFFGHSMGALIAYRLAGRRRASGRSLPDALLLSAYPAPHLPAPLPPSGHMDGPALARLLADLGGLPGEILSWPRWLEALLPVVRDDLMVCASHHELGEPPLACPVHLFGADADPLVSEMELRAWSRHVTRPSEVRLFPGDHFYLEDSPGELWRVLRPLLNHYAVSSSRDRATTNGGG
jgi:surfactin synthase thioesterase subunit